MALTRKMLKAMGIEDEKIDQIIEAHTETTEALKNERDKALEDAKRLPDLQKKLDEAEKLNSGEESYKAKYDALKTDFDKYKSEISAKEAHGAKETALRKLLKGIGIADKRIDTVVKVTDVDSIALDESEAIIDADKLEQSFKEEYADFITTEVKRGTTPETPPGNSGGTSMTREEIMKIKDAGKRQAAIAENHEMFGF